MQILFNIALLLFPIISFGQTRIENLLQEQADTVYEKHGLDWHSAIRPQTRSKDTVYGFGNQKQVNPFKIGVTPMVDLAGTHRNNTFARIGLGVQTEMQYKKFFWRLGTVAGYGYGPNNAALNTNAYFLQHSSSGTQYFYTDVRTRVAYTPNEVFQFQAGLDHHFFGEGVRSLWLSDYGIANPFGQIKVNFWRVQYDIIYQFMRENLQGERNNKFATTHHLSINILPWLNVGVFENVIYRPKTDGQRRGYEWEYLNPVIFLRPQEYAIGSSDNVLMGGSITAKIKQHTIYSQLVIDEFNFAEIRADRSYWANKLGIQLGVKGRFKTNQVHHFYRAEFNAIRPYTYSHIDTMHTYGHQGQPLAHPNGANFFEGILEYNIKYRRWNWGVFVRHLRKGYDMTEISYGGDIYKPYTARPGDYGAYIGMGYLDNLTHIQLNANYEILPKIKLNAYIQQHIQISSNNISYWPVIGVRSRLWNDYRNY